MGDSYSLTSEILKILCFLGLMLAVAVLVIRHNRRFSPLRGFHMSVMDTLHLGKNRFVCLVRLGKKVMVLGVTDNQINLLDKVGEGQLDTEDHHPHEPNPKRSFSEIIRDEVVSLGKRFKGSHLLVLLTIIMPVVLFPAMAFAQAAELPIPNIDITIDGQAQGGLGTALGILGLLTVLSLAPAILILTTSFTRIIIVFSFLRAGLGTQQTPANQILIGLALLLTFFIMAPTWGIINEVALTPYLNGEIPANVAIAQASVPIKEFMLRQTREKDLALFVVMNDKQPQTPDDLTLLQIVPAFAISELKTAFEMGFLLFLPFLVVDMVVASTLMSMGMLMLPPVLISLPFKILMFVLVDGWGLITRSLMTSFS